MNISAWSSKPGMQTAPSGQRTLPTVKGDGIAPWQWNAVQLPAIRAASDLERGRAAKAVELLASTAPYERAYPEIYAFRNSSQLDCQAACPKTWEPAVKANRNANLIEEYMTSLSSNR